uniref:ZU5 domain-containing protein n=1 Tax=Ascaris lumbricoides TaxID=6252 RepID=A0A0M3HQ93_ASCLU
MMTPTSQRRVVVGGSSGELTEDEMVGLISHEEGDQRGERVAHLVDGDIGYTTIPVEVLETAGIDIDNVTELSEEQMGTLLALASSGGTQHPSATSRLPARMLSPQKRAASPILQSDPADNLTMVISEDGSLKLTDSAQQNFFFSAEQLAAHNIDVNNLTDASIQQIVQIAMPSLDMQQGRSTGCLNPQLKIHYNFVLMRGKAAEQKRRKIDSSVPASTPAQVSYGAVLPQSSFQVESQGSSTLPTGKTTSLPNDHARVDQLALIGEEVEVKKNGKSLPATIRYCRHSGGYKVQFADGHFEWVTQDQIQNRSDHESYSGASEVEMSRTNAIGSSGIGRRAPPAIPGIKVTPSNGYEKDGEPNFCCVICDRKVYQKEPQYIVIRVPACDACTEKKIMVLDTATEERGIQWSPPLFEIVRPNSIEQRQSSHEKGTDEAVEPVVDEGVPETAISSSEIVGSVSLVEGMPRLDQHNET